MRLLSCIASLGFSAVAACSSASAGDPATSTNDYTSPTGDMCSTLDRGFMTHGAEAYELFANQQAAADFASGLLASGRLEDVMGVSPSYREISTDAHLNGLVADVFAAYKRVFPSETTGLEEPPPVAILESKKVNAFVIGGLPEFAGRSPWMVFFHTATLEGKPTDAQLRGVIAHELGHLILRNTGADFDRNGRTLYRVDPQHEDGILGATEPNDPAVSGHIGQILALQQRVGGLPSLGFPVLVWGTYPRLLLRQARGAVSTSATAETKTACEAVVASIKVLGTAQFDALPRGKEANYAPGTTTAQQHAELDRLSDDLKKNLAICLPKEMLEVSLAQIVAVLHGLPFEAAADPQHPEHAKVVNAMLEAETAIDQDTSMSSTAKIVAAIDALRAEAVRLREAPEYPIDTLRVFDSEEDSDDAAVRILLAMGDDPTATGTFLVDQIADPKVRAACYADVAAGQPVPYGQFVDDHPASCWRYYHATQIAKALSTCRGVPTPSMVKTPGRVAAGQKDPLANGRGSWSGH